MFNLKSSVFLCLYTIVIGKPDVLKAQIDSQLVVLEGSFSDTAIVKKPGHIEIQASRQILSLVDFYTQYTEEVKEMPGFRIEIFSASGSGSKYKARSVQSEFQETFTNIPGYVKWEYPNFEVRVGDFRTRLEAEKTLAAIKELFPFAYIKKDFIQPPQLSTPDKREQQEE